MYSNFFKRESNRIEKSTAQVQHPQLLAVTAKRITYVHNIKTQDEQHPIISEKYVNVQRVTTPQTQGLFLEDIMATISIQEMKLMSKGSNYDYTYTYIQPNISLQNGLDISII